MKRYTIVILRRIDRIAVVDNTPGSSIRAYYHKVIQLGDLGAGVTGTTNQEWLAKLPDTHSIICELDDYQDLPKLHPELFI